MQSDYNQIGPSSGNYQAADSFGGNAFPDKNSMQPPVTEEKPRGCGCFGCVSVLLLGTLLVCGGVCGGFYYAIFHSSMPLAQIEEVLESTGDIEVEGLTGSISSGFHMDQLRIRGGDGQWSTLEQVDFQFNGVMDLYRNRRLIIDRFSVGAGEILVSDFPDFDQSKDEPDQEMGEEEFEGADVEGMDGGEGLKEVQVGLLEVSNLKLINSATGVEFKIDKISVADFQYLNGQVTRLGDIIVATDHIEFASNPSDQFADQPDSVVTRNFVGVVRATMHEKLLADIAFDVDVCFPAEGKTLVQADFCNGKLVSSVSKDGLATTAFHDFSPADYIQPSGLPWPSRITGETRQQAGDQSGEAYAIAPGATFSLGQLPFDIETREIRVDSDAEVSPPITARHVGDTEDIVCRLYALEDKPYWAVELRSGDQENTPELFGRVFYGESMDSLDADQRSAIDAMLQTVQTLHGNVDEPKGEPQGLPEGDDVPDEAP